MPSVRISVTLITRNEAHQLERTLQSVKWADEIVVVDSGSTDGTQQLARELGARVVEHPWQGFGRQKNIAQDLASNDWILNLDADEVVSEELAREIQLWISEEERKRQSGGTPGRLAMPRKNFYGTRWIRHGGWYPNVVIRVGHKSASRWTEPHLHEKLDGPGEISTTRIPLLHHTFRSIEHQALTNIRYAREGAREMRRRGKSFSMARVIVKPFGKFIETYFLKLGFLDGRHGFIISMNAAHSMFLKQAFLLEESSEGELK